MILGIVSILFGCCCCAIGFPSAIGAVVCGVVAIQKINREPDVYGGKGLAIAGIVMGSSALVLSVISMVLGVASTLIDAAKKGHL